MDSKQAEVCVQLTNDSSIVSKASTCRHGYFVDPYVQHFAFEDSATPVYSSGSNGPGVERSQTDLPWKVVDDVRRLRTAAAAGGQATAAEAAAAAPAAAAAMKAPNVTGSRKKRPPRRAPLMHRGYAIRYEVVDRLVDRFLQRYVGAEQVNLLILGCGFDTLYWRFRDKFLGSAAACGASSSQHRGDIGTIMEVDFPEVIRRKREIVERNHGSFYSESTRCPGFARHFLIGADLKEPALLRAALEREFSAAVFDVPTLVLSEVVLAYLPTDLADSVLEWVGSTFSRACCLCYEQILPETSFGRIMTRHFQNRNSPLFPIFDYQTCAESEAARGRFFRDVQGVDLYSLLYGSACSGSPLFSTDDRRELLRSWQSLEPFDEFEEWHLKLQHYYVLCASNECQLLHGSVGGTHCTGQILPSDLATPVELAKPTIVRGAARSGACGVVVPAGDAAGAILLCGGFGPEADGQHARLQHAAIVPLDDPSAGAAPSGVGRSIPLPHPACMFSRMVASGSGEALVVGGRESPGKASAAVVRLGFRRDPCGSLAGEVASVRSSVAHESGAFPPRFRHGAVSLPDGSLAVLGGRDGSRCLDDAWIGSRQGPGEILWRVAGVRLPSARHSFAYSVVEDGRVLLFGGLDEAETVLDEVLAIDFERATVEAFPLNMSEARRSYLSRAQSSQPRSVSGGSYGAVAVRCACGTGAERILLVGDLLAQAANRNDLIVYCFDVASMRVDGVSAFDLGEEVWLPCNHQAGAVAVAGLGPAEGATVVAFGGGGNCFSFGTHLNERGVRMDIGLGR